MSPFVRSIIKKLLPSQAVHAIKQWRLRRLIQHFPARTVAHCYGGHDFSVRLTDTLAESWYDHDWPELREIVFMRQGRLQAGARVFDLGAHQGVVAMMLAREVTPGGQVVAVEATPHNASVARQNMVLNGLADQVTIIHALVAKESGQSVPFTATLNGQVSQTAVGESMLTVSVDSLAGEFGRPDVVVIDIEGYEGEALAGATAVLRHGAEFFVEVHVGAGLEQHTTKEAILQVFVDNGYSCFVTPEAHGDFVAWYFGMPLPEERFFLIARPPVANQDVR
ncbi:FkbM family methyltransferase [Prosthecobacter sp.]|jgi:FkbM family methyltransferase|uniref:FkbM family methyltransferase n=1 Tax=Prosthecobacter sp. TaxID=1965333 RepID=UPI0037C8A167